MEQVAARKVGESGTYYFRQAVWSALMISSAINTMMILVESGPSLSLMFIVIIPSWEYVTLSLVLFSDMVRSWCDNQDATLNESLTVYTHLVSSYFRISRS